MNETETVSRLSYLNNIVNQIEQAIIKCMEFNLVVSDLLQLKHKYLMEMKGLESLCRERSWRM